MYRRIGQLPPPTTAPRISTPAAVTPIAATPTGTLLTGNGRAAPPLPIVRPSATAATGRRSVQH